MKGERGYPGLGTTGQKGEQGELGSPGPPGPPCEYNPEQLEQGNLTQTGPPGPKGEKGYDVRCLYISFFITWQKPLEEHVSFFFLKMTEMFERTCR